MAGNFSPQLASVTALASILRARPEASALTWTIDPAGVLHGQQIAATGYGDVIDAVADYTGGTALHTVMSRGTDRTCLAQLVTVWRGVPVEIWASYAEPAPLPLATVAVIQAYGGAA